jgi:hypothetical protein
MTNTPAQPHKPVSDHRHFLSYRSRGRAHLDTPRRRRMLRWRLVRTGAKVVWATHFPPAADLVHQKCGRDGLEVQTELVYRGH